ncbi:branched-chain amino acid transport system permease protein [Frankia sp. Hr75.2]|nr:branched-chain amino acid transport system permease protein [Frankia sp. Hr75.2]
MLNSVVAGLPGGAAYAIVGVVLVLQYRMAGVVNFAVGGISVFGAVVFAKLFGAQVPMWVSLIAGLALSSLIAFTVGVAMVRWFSDKSILNRSAVTIAVGVSLSALALRAFGPYPYQFPTLFASWRTEIGSTVVPGATFFAVGLTCGLSLALWALLRWTRVGTLMRAISNRAPTAALLGVPISALTGAVWALGGAVGTLALMLLAPSRQTDVPNLGAIMVGALAAALVGAFNSFTLTVIGGLAIGIFEAIAVSDADLATYDQVVPFVVIIAALMWNQRREAWNEDR